MTKQEILDGNRLIAEFMQVEIKENFHKLFYYSDQPFYYVDGKSREEVLDKASSYFKYHLSWDWLMPVVEKIEIQSKDLFGEYEDSIINGCGFMIPLPEFNISIAEVSKIAAVYVGVLKYIDWYNSQKEK